MIGQQLIECVPNFSEGRDEKKINSIAEAIRSTVGVELLHIDSGYDANRTVYTLVGSPDAVVAAITSAFRTAKQVCNMANHLGTHPRIGLLDVCPLIPLRNISIAETHEFAIALALNLVEEHNQTIYLYESSATNPNRKNLASIRRGEYEGLKRKLNQVEWKPDFGSEEFLPRTGASIIGVRPFLIAYNVNLDTKSVPIANTIAQRIRTSGYHKELTPRGLKEKVAGLLPELKAIGWYVEELQIAQVSMNIIDFHSVGMQEAYEACVALAQELGVEVTGSELIGLVPLDAILAAGRYYATRDHAMDRSQAALVEIAVQNLGLGNLKPFVPADRIIEYQIKA